MTKLLIATSNEGKAREIEEILKDLPFSAQVSQRRPASGMGGPGPKSHQSWIEASGWEILSLKDAGIDFKIKETGKTFEENAVLKAKGYAKKTSLLTLAEDSGLEIDCLGGKPGVYSARFLEGKSQEEKNQAILEKMKDIPEEKRTARFIDIVAIATPSGKIETAEGVMEGRIVYKAKGENGFGYDPIFIPHLLSIAHSRPDKYLSTKGAGFIPNRYDKTNAELTLDEKNKISHRAKALCKAKKILKDLT